MSNGCRISSEHLLDIESKARRYLGKTPIGKHLYGDSEILGLCMDLRECRARCADLEKAVERDVKSGVPVKIIPAT